MGKKSSHTREIKMPEQNFITYMGDAVLSGAIDRDRSEWAKQMWFVHSFQALNGTVIVLYEKFNP